MCSFAKVLSKAEMVFGIFIDKNLKYFIDNEKIVKYFHLKLFKRN